MLSNACSGEGVADFLDLGKRKLAGTEAGENLHCRFQPIFKRAVFGLSALLAKLLDMHSDFSLEEVQREPVVEWLVFFRPRCPSQIAFLLSPALILRQSRYKGWTRFASSH